MNVSRLLQTIFLILSVVGLFAAMARNPYGFDLIGVSCFGLATIFLVQVIWRLVDEFEMINRAVIIEIGELILLSGLTILFGMRSFYIYLDNGNTYFNVILGFQVMLYVMIGYSLTKRLSILNMALSRQMIYFYSSLILFLFSIVFRTYVTISQVFGVLGLIISIPFTISIVRQQKFELRSKAVGTIEFITSSKNKAGILFLFFIASALFTGLVNLKVIPSIENATQPNAYIKLINDAESGKEVQVDGKYHHERYKEIMDKFLERHGKK
jgi:hypothetical protein